MPDTDADTKDEGTAASSEAVQAAVQAAVGPVLERLDEINARYDDVAARMEQAQQASVDEILASAPSPELPPPPGFHDRTWIEYTTADVSWLELSGRMAAASSAPDRGASQRKKDAASGVAMPDGSYPIKDATDLKNAKQAVGRAPASKQAAVKAHINKRAKALGLPGIGQSDGAKKAA